MIMKPELINYGKSLEKLGLAIQDPNTTISELSDLAFDCGLTISLPIEPELIEEIDVDHQE